MEYGWNVNGIWIYCWNLNGILWECEWNMNYPKSQPWNMESPPGMMIGIWICCWNMNGILWEYEWNMNYQKTPPWNMETRTGNMMGIWKIIIFHSYSTWVIPYTMAVYDSDSYSVHIPIIFHSISKNIFIFHSYSNHIPFRFHTCFPCVSAPSRHLPGISPDFLQFAVSEATSSMFFGTFEIIRGVSFRNLIVSFDVGCFPSVKAMFHL